MVERKNIIWGLIADKQFKKVLKFHFIKMFGGSFLIDYFPVKLVATDFLLVAFAAMAIAFIASWFPAYKASKQPLELR